MPLQMANGRVKVVKREGGRRVEACCTSHGVLPDAEADVSALRAILLKVLGTGHVGER